MFIINTYIFTLLNNAFQIYNQISNTRMEEQCANINTSQLQKEEKVEEKHGHTGCTHQHKQKEGVVIQPREEQQKKKLQLFILGVQPFVLDQNQEDANFISCRLGEIAEDTLKSKNLKFLYLRNNLIQTIRGFDLLPNLVELQLYDNKIMKIEGLDALTNLELLDLSYNNIKKIENISHLKKLKKLYLLSNKIKKIQNLDFPQLEMLQLGSNKIREIQNLQGVKNIKSLFLGKNRIHVIKNLKSLHQLQQIALGPNKLTEINQALLCLKDTLKQLYLQENQISAINNVNQLTKLQILDISYNKVEHLNNINQLTNLQCLYLNANKIHEYQQLYNLKSNRKLNTISLFGNDVTKEPGYRMKLVELLPEIDDIDGTPMKTSYKIVFGSNNEIKKQ